MHYLGTILGIIYGYFVGSISFSIIIVYALTKRDVRSQGSNNAGATNAARVLGKRWGLFIVFLDAFKVMSTGFLCVGLSMINSSLFSETSYFIPMVFAVVGHCYPIYYKFKGGKAVSGFIGLLIMTNWISFLVFAFVWWTLIFIFKYVSLSSICAAAAAILSAWLPWLFGTNAFDLTYVNFTAHAYGDNQVVFAWLNWLHKFQPHTPELFSGYVEMCLAINVSGILLIVKHRENIKRLINHTEKRFLKSKKDKLSQTQQV